MADVVIVKFFLRFLLLFVICCGIIAKRCGDFLVNIDKWRRLAGVFIDLEGLVGSKHTGLFLSRFGGDEFAAIYETRGEANVKSLCEQIKETLIEDNQDLAYPLTIGVGFAKYKGADMPLDMLYDLADKALYIDKNSG